MDYFLTDTQQKIKELTRRFAEERIVPVRAELDDKEIFPGDILAEMGRSDLFCLYIPEEYGGLNGGCMENCVAVEEISRACTGVAVSYAASALGAYPIVMFGTDEQKAAYLPDIASGRKLGAFALTESNAGSDAGGIQTTAVKDGDCYILNGSKQWITNGGEADIYTVIALTDREKGSRGASAFIVEKGLEGFTFGPKEKKLGIRCSSTTSLYFENCRVPAKNLLGREGQGYIVAMKNLDISRPGIGAQAVGVAQGAFEAALSFSRQRIQFGQPISSFQAIQHILADMAASIEASRALVYATARFIDSGPKSYSKESSMSKFFPADVAMKVTTDAVQVFGGHGYMREYPVEKMMRDAKIIQIYEGTNQIQRNVVASQLIKEEASRKK